MSTKMEIYTVYRHTNPLNNEVFYIGKGTESRKRRYRFWEDRNSSYREVLKSITDVNLTPYVDVLNTTTEEDTAYYLERMWISWYGRKDLKTGTLVNLTDGGIGARGAILSDETKRKISEAQKGEKNHRYGKKNTDETRRKISEANKGKVSNKRGIKLCDETRRKMSESSKGKKNPFYGVKHSDESRKKMSESKRGENHPFYGVKHSDETKLKMSIANKAAWAKRKSKSY